MKIMKDNKKGFTLVELLAVIVILALIMSIAFVSMGNVMRSAQNSTFKENAIAMIDGVKQRLVMKGRLEAGQYFFNSSILEKGGVTSPRGGDFQFVTKPGTNSKTKLQSTGTAQTVVTIEEGLYKYSGSAIPCSNTTFSNVTVTLDNTGGSEIFTYRICLTAGAGNPFIDGSLREVKDEDNVNIIKES